MQTTPEGTAEAAILNRLVKPNRLVFLLAVALCTGGVWYWYSSGWTKEDVEHLLKKSTKPGMAREEIKAWLNSHGFLNHQYHWGSGGISTKVDPDKIDGYFQVWIPGRYGIMSQEIISVTFYFDKEYRLVEHKVSSVIMAS